ncbi:MAG: rod shape-determining protein MreC [Candidatus Omnitrophica bacterium]|nr:rod shape-determining protein MreC [Candidatus Omnitrophota bacterium]MBU4473565.1 rod shape-determining protein MreC [Candidatus Omnitrophota bacterium]
MKFKKKSLIYLAVSIFLLTLLSSLNPALRTTILSTFKYPLSLLTLIRREIGGIIFYHRNLMQNEGLKREVDLLRNKINTLDEIYLENRRLNDILSLKQKTPYKVIAARVIGRSPDNWSSVVIIDKGRYNGIKQEMAAMTYLGFLGRVIETTESTSKIMLINDPNLGVSCIVVGSRQEGLVSGTLGNSLIMKYLPKGADIKISDVIITSGLTDAYPKGLLIGEVIEVGEELSGLTRYAIIKPAVNLSSIEEVLIIIP